MIYKNVEKEKIGIVAFCIMNNHAHLLLTTDNINNLSKYMQKINSEYGKYYNYMEGRVGYVFRERYKSEPITNQRYLIQCVKYIHQNPVKAKMVQNAEDYRYSSYNVYKKMIENNRKNNIFSIEELNYICNENKYVHQNFIDIDTNIEENINYSISDFVYKENIKVFEIFENSDILKELIRYLKIERHIKYVDIMKYLNITKGTMERFKS